MMRPPVLKSSNIVDRISTDVVLRLSMIQPHGRRLRLAETLVNQVMRLIEFRRHPLRIPHHKSLLILLFNPLVMWLFYSLLFTFIFQDFHQPLLMDRLKLSEQFGFISMHNLKFHRPTLISTSAPLLLEVGEALVRASVPILLLCESVFESSFSVSHH